MHSRALDRLRLSLAGLLLVGCKAEPELELTACGKAKSGNLPGPPRLLSARMEDNRLVRLTFSEPLASVADVDPASFRISWAIYEQDFYDNGYTLYYDPMAFLCAISDFCIYDYTDVIELGCATDDQASLLLRLDSFRRKFICASVGEDAPLLAHFDAGAGEIRDLDGEALESIAAHWVQEESVYTELDGRFPNYPMLIPIDCGE